MHTDTTEGTGPRNFLRPCRGASRWYLAGYVAMFERSQAITRVSDDFLRRALGKTPATIRGS